MALVKAVLLSGMLPELPSARAPEMSPMTAIVEAAAIESVRMMMSQFSHQGASVTPEPVVTALLANPTPPADQVVEARMRMVQVKVGVVAAAEPRRPRADNLMLRPSPCAKKPRGMITGGSVFCRLSSVVKVLRLVAVAFWV